MNPKYEIGEGGLPQNRQCIMKDQKFQIGDLVRLKYGHRVWSMKKGKDVEVIDIQPDRKDELAVILYTYNLKYGDAAKPDNRYGVMMLGTGLEWAWMDDEQADLVETNCGRKYINQAVENTYKNCLVLSDFKITDSSRTVKKGGPRYGVSAICAEANEKQILFQVGTYNEFIKYGDKILSIKGFPSKEEAESLIEELRKEPRVFKGATLD